MNCSVVSLILLTVVINCCTVQGSCERAPGKNCCASGYFYDLQSQNCIKEECPPGFTGTNCTMECRFPNYGYLCQSECKCSEEDCNSSTGCPHDRQRDSTKTDLERSPDVQVGSIVVSIVVVLAVIVAAIISRYTRKKYVVRKRELKHVEEILTYRHLGAKNDNLYDMDERNVDLDIEKNEKGPGTVDETLKNDAALTFGCTNDTNEYLSISNNLNGQNMDDDERKNENGPETVDDTLENLKLFKPDHQLDETNKSLYDNVCEENADTDNGKNGDEQNQIVNTTENDYVDSLAFNAEKKNSCRDSQHFYDSLN